MLTRRDSSVARSYATAARPAAALAMLLATAVLFASCGGAPSTTVPVRHQPTATPASPPPVMYVALGASDAVGVGADNPNTQAYVPIIISRLPHGSEALNLGVSGITLREALQQELPQAIAAHPTLVTIWLAGNDFRQCVPLQQYAHDLDTLLTTLHTQTHARVFVANLPDMSLLPYFQDGAVDGGACVDGATPTQDHALVVQWDTVIDSAVTQHGDVLVDLLHSDLAAHPDYVSLQDGFHPSSRGYARLADLFWGQIIAHHAVPTK